MATRDALLEQFSQLGVPASEASLAKCVELCSSHGLSAEALVETWVSFTVSSLQGADPTPELLALMERRELHGVPAAPGVATTAARAPAVYAAAAADDDPGGDRIVQLYAAAKGTPERRNVAKAPVFSPASFSPGSATPSSSYAARSDSGAVVCSFPEGLPGGGATWTSDGRREASVTLLDAAPKQDYMEEEAWRRAEVLSDVLEDFSEAFQTARGLEELVNPLRRAVEDQWTVGRVACEPLGRLDPFSVMLECPRGLAGGRAVRLDLRRLQRYALFPGQMVAVYGTNLEGDAFVVSQLLTDFYPLFPFLPAGLRVDDAPEGLKDGPLQLVVAAGPYTQTDTLLYQPLQDLVRYLEERRPHVAVLCGPFVDARHPHVQEGVLAETLDDVFERILEGLSGALRSGRTQVVLVPSHRDAHHFPVFPTPPFAPRRPFPGVHLVPDPCTISVEGFKVAVTSVDVLMHLGKEELSHPPHGPDRLGRLAGHVLSQGCFYPLFPPPEDLPLDVSAWREMCRLSRRPHLLVLPSDLRFFVKEVDGCLVVNPGRLSKGKAGGTVARLEVPAFPPDGDFCKVVKAQVLKI